MEKIAHLDYVLRWSLWLHHPLIAVLIVAVPFAALIAIGLIASRRSR